MVILAAAAVAGPLCAAPPRIDASTRLDRCGEQTCLRINGRRADPDAPILIAGHPVAVEGGRNWRVDLPLRMIRAWSAPAARRISVALAGRDGGEVQAALPIGLLGHVTRLASLDVSARR